ncbi:MAG: phosphonate metabolism protein/1,5-bisphosphokinase (PRPP-forming) PhnN [Alphaproteobacteria bacterium]|nr:phosphonate metabolism protein/1,5-bisphosphokinase (PRPP-forming) PhnN [Alphaproteobacteria bacterium]
MAGSIQGVLVLVVGPSGAGKDSVLGGARERLYADPSVVFPRRVITRAPDLGLEDHDTLDETAFDAAVEGGAFALHWRAHALCYGIPVAIEDHLRTGRVVIVNGSRTVVGEAQRKYVATQTVVITAPARVIAERLAVRGRETDLEVADRLARKALTPPPGDDVHHVMNDGDLNVAVDQFVDIVGRFSAL